MHQKEVQENEQGENGGSSTSILDVDFLEFDDLEVDYLAEDELRVYRARYKLS